MATTQHLIHNLVEASKLFLWRRQNRSWQPTTAAVLRVLEAPDLGAAQEMKKGKQKGMTC
jgi:hypothetical protein